MLLRRLARAAYGAAALVLLCLSMEQVLLCPPLFSKLLELAFGGRVQISYGSAWSLLPGRLQVRGLEMRGEDDNVQWNLSIDEVAFRVSLHELFTRAFHATWVRARGVGWALRIKRPLLEVTPETLFGLPAIRGFGGMALKPYGPDELDTDANYRLWTVHLDQVVATEVREIWIEKLHLMGDAQLTGGFFLKPIRRVAVMAQVATQGLDLTIGDDAVARGLRGQLAVTVHPFDPREGHGRSPLSSLDLRAQLDGQSGDLGFIRRTLPDGESLSADPGAFSLRLAIDHGVLGAGSAALLTLPRLDAERSGLLANTAVRCAVTVNPPASPAGLSQASAAVELSALTLSLHHSSNQLADISSLRVIVESTQLDLARPLEWSSLSANIERARAPELARFQPLLPTGFPLQLTGGAAQARATLEATPDNAQGKLVFSIGDASVKGDKPGARWSANGEVRLREHKPAGPFDLSGSLLTAERTQESKSPGPRWWGRLEFPRALVNTGSTTAFTLRGACLDASPLLPLLEAQGVPGFVAGLFKMPGLTFGGSLLLGARRLAVTGLKAQGGGASFLANYNAENEEKRGEAFITLGHTAFGLDLDGGRAHVILVDATSWYQDRLHRMRPPRVRPALRTQVALDHQHASTP